MSLSRDVRRRLFLYGSAACFAAVVLTGPWLIARLAPRVAVKSWDVDAAVADESTQLLIEYVRINSTNPPGSTRETVALWMRRFGCEGIPFEVVGDDPERPVFVARLEGQKRGDAVLLLHHMDVHPVGDLSKWTKPPLAAELGTKEDKGFLYGRGTLDMKNLGVAFFAAMAQLKRDGIVPRHDVVFLAEPGEEAYQPEIGVGWVLKHRPDLLEGVTDVLNEGGVNEVITDRIARFGIEVLQKANIVCKASAPSKEALEAYAALLKQKMADYPFQVSDEVQDFLRFIGPSRSDLWGHQMFDVRRAIREKLFLVELPEVYQSLLKDMFYSGKIEPVQDGASWSTEVVATLLPGSSVRARWAEMQGWAAPLGVALQPELVSDDSVATPRTGKVWEALNQVFSLDEERADVGLYVLSGSYTNSSYLRVRGLRAFGVSPFFVHINDAVRIHGFNERVNVPRFVEGVARMKAILRELATAP